MEIKDQGKSQESTPGNDQGKNLDGLTPEQLEEMQREGGNDDGGDGVKPYTPDELNAILEADGNIDPNRLDEAGKLIYKTFERGYTKKFMKLSDKEKELENKKEEEPEGDKDIFQLYDENPSKVLDYLNKEIDNSMTEEPHKAIQLMNLKTKLLERQQLNNHAKDKEISLRQQVDNELDSLIEGFQAKKDKLVEFCVNKLDYEIEDIIKLTNPSIVGKNAVIRFVTSLNKMYDLAVAGTSLKKKEVKNQMKNEGPGSNSGRTDELTVTKLEKERNDLLEAAKKSGRSSDWAAYSAANRKFTVEKQKLNSLKGG